MPSARAERLKRWVRVIFWHAQTSRANQVCRQFIKWLAPMPMAGPKRFVKQLMRLYYSATTGLVSPQMNVLTVAVHDNWRDFREALKLLTPHGSGRWGAVHFAPASQTTAPDFWLILNSPENDIVIDAPPERIWFASGEPPTKAYRPFHLGQGKGTTVLTCDPDLASLTIGEENRRFILSPVMARTWRVKRSIDELGRSPRPDKPKTLSWVTSNTERIEGHRRRMAFLRSIQGRVSFDLYGRGFRPIYDKWEGVAPYKYSIAFENFVSPYYFTEKLMDCFVCLTLPFYFGSPQAGKFFPSRSFIIIDPDDPHVAEKITDVSKSDLWLERQSELEEARWLTLYKYNIFSQISRLMLQSLAPPSDMERIAVHKSAISSAGNEDLGGPGKQSADLDPLT